MVVGGSVGDPCQMEDGQTVDEVVRKGRRSRGELREGVEGEEREEEQIDEDLVPDYHQSLQLQRNSDSNGSDVGSSWETCTGSQGREMGGIWVEQTAVNGKNQSWTVVVAVVRIPNPQREGH